MLLENKHVVLASGSPRRVLILQENKIDFEIVKPTCEENITTDIDPRQTVMALALRKALSIGKQDGLIIACDTVVVHNNKVIGKPKDEQDAFDTLKELSGQKHQVVSGVCLIDSPVIASDNSVIVRSAATKQSTLKKLFTCTTDVYFKDYSDQEIWDYIKTGEPMDKAGSYAIQGIFSKYIDHIDGSYNNVVGFPFEMIKEEIENA
ncbi:MAG: Maf family protein [Bacillota bacterium]|nr:Maf family protein [Bacillota bacterium]